MQKISNLTEIPPVRDYLNRIGAEPRGLRTAVVKETHGRYWRDVAVIRFSQSGDINCSSLAHGPTAAEQAAIKAAWPTFRFPQIKLISQIINPPPAIANADKRNVFEFRDVTGEKILMVQVRIQQGSEKKYVPWTYWDDDRWRCAEPDGELPLWGLDQLRQHKTIFIHEGAKAAAYCRWLVEGKTQDARRALAEHPWGAELIGAAHVGWIGGALNPRRTDWSPIAQFGIERAYIVADNDEPGKSAVAAISEHLHIKTMSIEFTDEFPRSFDLADPFPEKMFEGKFYKGPAMRDLMHPATWATDQIPNPSGTGRPSSVLRDSFSKMWAYVEDADLFVCTEMPNILRNEAVFNRMVAPFSHVFDTARLLVKHYKGRAIKLCYRPDIDERLINDKGTTAINLYMPSLIRPIDGDTGPWEEFLNYLFVHQVERAEVKRWLATLIARPEVRMAYGLLLVSEKQGVGKTTLGECILAPLVGENNVSYPGENNINSSFNGWIAGKRLAVVNEIYCGSSWKAYHTLKTIITDKEITVNQKYMREYVLENWCHIFACSNSMRALKMEQDDRRWFYPEVTERPWAPVKFKQFRKWLSSGGLGIIRKWAENYGDYVHPEEHAPMTERKRELIDESRSEGQRAACELAELMIGRDEPIALAMKDIVAWVKQSVQGKLYDSDYELRRAMVEMGVKKLEKRMKVQGILQYVVMNEKLHQLVIEADTKHPEELVRKYLVKPEALIEPQL